ncbi:MAG: alpha/beta hydrolase [Bacteriovoracaceae bacterium]
MKLLLCFLLFMSGCSHLFYQPTRIGYVDPARLKLSYQDIYFSSLDGVKLHSWFFKSTTKSSKGTLIFFHGNAQNLSAHYLNLIWVLNEGYNLFVFDYRGYGQSEGVPNQKGIYLDALAALEMGRELNNQHGNGKLVVYGQSLGGIISLRAIPDFKYADDIDLIVQDSTFTSYQNIAFDKLTSRWFLWPISPLAYVLVSDEMNSKDVISKITRPTLVIVGKKDEIVPPSQGESLYKELSTKKWLWELPEGTHIDVFHHANFKYRKEFLDLIDKLTQQ